MYIIVYIIVYVGQTVPRNTTKILKHQNNDTHVGQHRIQCCIRAYKIECGIFNACRSVKNWWELRRYASKLQLIKGDKNRRQEST